MGQVNTCDATRVLERINIYSTVPMDICSVVPRYHEGLADLVRKTTFKVEQKKKKKTQPTGPAHRPVVAAA